MTKASSQIVLEARGLNKTYSQGDQDIVVLQSVDLSVKAGEMVAIVGASGSGKSTLLHCLGLLDMPDAGEVIVNGQASGELSETDRSRLRNQSLGFVYQFHHLLAEFSALDNVAMPLIIGRHRRSSSRQAARDMLGLVGLEQRVHHFPGQLSGGERQRVALARALVTKPVCILADEPTGNLDRGTAQSMFELLVNINRKAGTALIIVTHDLALAELADTRYAMDNGRLACL